MITIMYSNYVPTVGHVSRLEALVGQGGVHVANDETSAIATAANTRVVLGHRYLHQFLPHAPNLRWVQSSAAGFDQLPTAELAAKGIMLSRNPLGAKAIANHVVALAWGALRRIPMALRAQDQGHWTPPFPMLPLPRTSMILGLGNIGLAVAALFKGLGLRVLGTGTQGSATQRRACDEFLLPHQWRTHLPEIDILVLALPLNKSTKNCIGRGELAELPNHAIVINVGRAGTLDHNALTHALSSGRLGGAGLDVLDPIPAPNDSFWRTPNLIVTPKAASYHPAMQAEFEAYAEAQVRRFLARQPIEHLVALT